MNNEFYYFDGVQFQKVLNLESIKGIPVDNTVEDSIFYGFFNTINTLLTIKKIEKKCFYKIDKVNSLFSILTPTGWETLACENMDIRARGMDLIDIAKINFINSLVIKVDDKLTFNKLEIKNLDLIGIPNPIVREVPKSIVSDTLAFTDITLKEVALEDQLKINFINSIINSVEERLRFNNINFNSLNTLENVEIILERG